MLLWPLLGELDDLHCRGMRATVCSSEITGDDRRANEAQQGMVLVPKASLGEATFVSAFVG